MVGHVTGWRASPIHYQAITAARNGAIVMINRVDATELQSMEKMYVVNANESQPPTSRSCLSIDLMKNEGVVLRRIQTTSKTMNVRLIDR